MMELTGCSARNTQKRNFRANSNSLDGTTVEVITPVLPGPSVMKLSGSPNTGWLNALKSSNRNSTFVLSLVLNILRSARSAVTSPGPSSTFFPESPQVYCAGNGKQLTSNQLLIDRFPPDKFPLQIRSVRASPKEPVFEGSKPIAGEK